MNGSKVQVVLSGNIRASQRQQAGASGLLSLLAGMAFEVPDGIGVTHSQLVGVEMLPGVQLVRLAVFSEPTPGGDALVFIEVKATAGDVHSLVGRSCLAGMVLIPIDPATIRDRFPERGWWRGQEGNLGSLVVEYRHDPECPEQDRAAKIEGRHLVEAVRWPREQLLDRDRFEWALRPHTRYLESEVTEVLAKDCGINLLGFVASPFDAGRRRRVEALFQLPPPDKCPFEQSGNANSAPGVREKIEAVCLARNCDFVKIFNLSRPDPEAS